MAVPLHRRPLRMLRKGQLVLVEVQGDGDRPVGRGQSRPELGHIQHVRDQEDIDFLGQHAAFDHALNQGPGRGVHPPLPMAPGKANDLDRPRLRCRNLRQVPRQPLFPQGMASAGVGVDQDEPRHEVKLWVALQRGTLLAPSAPDRARRDRPEDTFQVGLTRFHPRTPPQ